MKKRTGFVSNSSSSSFVIKKGEVFNDTREIAKYMLPSIDWMDEHERNRFIKILDSVKENDNITFQTTNYDTYIQYLMGHYFVETANNHSWGMKLTNSHVSKLPAEFNDIIDTEYLYCGEHEFTDVNKYEAKFYSLPLRLHIDRVHYDSKPAWDDRYCKNDNHYVEKVCIDGIWYCPSCEGDLSRKLKIKKLIDK